MYFVGKKKYRRVILIVATILSQKVNQLQE